MTSENNPSRRPPADARKRAGRSPQANGKLHGRGIDRRRAPAKRFRDAVEALCAELGRPLAALSEVERTRVRLAAHFIVVAERTQAQIASGKPTDVEQDVRVANTLARLLDDLGLSPQGAERRRAAEADAKLKEEARRHGVIVHDG
jgi:hypothetical protein